jgi:UDP-N-acetylglucosamine--N-acetylmuramyl-(pentapeptide) pyrophosphoryl-undecaprenol N-acetylglucosamine transferase
MRVLIAAGGTGGHIYPGLAIASYLKEHHLADEILMVGGERELESYLVSSQGFNLRQIGIHSYPRYFSSKWIIFGWSLCISFFQSLFILRAFKPQVIIGMGSFHSCPLIILAFFFGIPNLICEQNVRLSLSNKLLAPWTSRIALSFSETEKYLSPKQLRKTYLTGNPIRSEIIKVRKEEAIEKLNLDKDKFTLLFLGGSQGAHSLNRFGIEAVRLLAREKLDKEIQVIFITGKKDVEWVKTSFKSLAIKSIILSYLPQMEYAYAASDLVICRSGATTLAELMSRGLPAILIPYPYATGGHQWKNAKVLQAMKAAHLILEEDFILEKLTTTILELITNKSLLKEMAKKSKTLGKPQATREVVKLTLSLVNQ